MIHPNMLFGVDTKKWKIGTYRLTGGLCWSRSRSTVEMQGSFYLTVYRGRIHCHP